MITTEKYSTIASDQAISAASESLESHGINVEVVENLEDAKRVVLEMVPEGSEVFTMTSVTLDEAGISAEINESGKYKSVRNALNSMDRATQGHEMNQLGAAPQITLGSVHAVTEDGKVLIASKTGSQLPAYASAAGKVIWVVGTQKIVKDLDEGMDRLYNHSLPLEEQRAQKAYGVGSEIDKILIVNKEIKPDRITMVLVKEVVGF